MSSTRVCSSRYRLYAGQLAHEEQWYQNHVSCGNGTSYSVFGMFTGLQPSYWTAWDTNRTSPVLVDELLKQGYNVRTYPSASLVDPPFARILFGHVPNLRIRTAGNTSYDRDMNIKEAGNKNIRAIRFEDAWKRQSGN